jgi:hypothetical protein
MSKPLTINFTDVLDMNIDTSAKRDILMHGLGEDFSSTLRMYAGDLILGGGVSDDNFYNQQSKLAEVYEILTVPVVTSNKASKEEINSAVIANNPHLVNTSRCVGDWTLRTESRRVRFVPDSEYTGEK